MTIYYDESVAENGRPLPSNRPDDYTTSGIWWVVWGSHGSGESGFMVERRGDNHPTERYSFSTTTARGYDGPHDGSQPRDLIATPTTRATAQLRHTPVDGKVKAETKHGRGERTRSESISPEDLPDAVKRVVEANDHITLVESLYD